MPDKPYVLQAGRGHSGVGRSSERSFRRSRQAAYIRGETPEEAQHCSWQAWPALDSMLQDVLAVLRRAEAGACAWVYSPGRAQP